MAASSERKSGTSGRANRKLHQNHQKRQRLFAIFGGALAIAIVAAGILIAVNRDSGGGGDVATVVAASLPDTSIAQDGMTIGSPDAPVTVTEFGDYQCPFCGQFSASGFQTLLTSYIASGQVKLTFSPFSFLGDESTAATEAALCAADQGKFWAMHETLYANQAGENKGGFSSARLKLIASQAGLDTNAYNSCMSNKTHEAEVSTFNTTATNAGVNSTPSFAINGGFAAPYSSYADLEAKIKAALGQ